jgi:MFS transporter, ACS family, hexuronate transporter
VTERTSALKTPARPIKGLRWYIGGLLFASTVINYIDRQTLSVLAPFLKADFHWTNTDFAFIVIAFRAAYAIGQTVAGGALDRLGTRAGLTIGVAWYSIAAMLTSLATGFWSFCGFRFLLGAGEAANWPGATKAVSEWFPRRESGWAVALFDSGSSIGGAVAPFLVLGLHRIFGTWRPAFIVTGALGFAWLFVFRRVYRLPEEHPRISAEELALILDDRSDGTPEAELTGAGQMATQPPATYRELLSLPQTWGIIIGKMLTDPVWFFITDWFAIYIVSRGFKLEDSLLAFWVPFLAADAGNFIGGGVSSTLIRRGWTVGAARRLVIVLGGIGMSGLAVSLLHDGLIWLTTWFAI